MLGWGLGLGLRLGLGRGWRWRRCPPAEKGGAGLAGVDVTAPAGGAAGGAAGAADAAKAARGSDVPMPHSTSTPSLARLGSG